MDIKLLYIKSVTLLYRESTLPKRSVDSRPLIQQAITSTKQPDQSLSYDLGKDPLTALRDTINWMCSVPQDYNYNVADLMQRLRVNLQQDDYGFDAIRLGIEPPLADDALIQYCREQRELVVNYLKQVKVREALKSAYVASNFHSDDLDWSMLKANLMEELDKYPFNKTGSTITHPAQITGLKLSDQAAVSHVMQQRVDSLKHGSVLRYGYQALNRMMGKQGGGIRGDFVVNGGLQHSNKSGFMMDLHRQVALYNTPVIAEDGRKPALVRISFENSTSSDLLYMYKQLVAQREGILVDDAAVDTAYAAGYVTQALNANGWENFFYRFNGSDFTYIDLIDVYEHLKAEGYEVQASWVDYLNLMSKRGCDGNGPTGSNIRDLFRRVRNYTNPERILFHTPHQLGPIAKKLVREGHGEHFVNEVVNKGYWDGCSTIDQEVDVELIHHIVKQGGQSYFTLARGKHRGVNDTPEEDLSTVLKFEPIGGILDDINGEDLSRRSIGNRSMGEGGGVNWFDSVVAGNDATMETLHQY